MTDYSCYYFSVKWAGSNIDIASILLLRVYFNNPAWLNSSLLQDKVGALVNIDPRSIKILLGLPVGPQLTPVLLTPKVGVTENGYVDVFYCLFVFHDCKRGSLKTSF